MDFIQRIWNRLPWFKLRTRDGDWIGGKMHPDKSIELTIETQWGNVLVLVGAEEGLKLRDWLVKAYHNPENADGLAAVLPIRKSSRDPGPGSPGAG